MRGASQELFRIDFQAQPIHPRLCLQDHPGHGSASGQLRLVLGILGLLDCVVRYRSALVLSQSAGLHRHQKADELPFELGGRSRDLLDKDATAGATTHIIKRSF